MKKVLEVCAGDLESVVAAAQGGATRVELCSALCEGGVTPSVGIIACALDLAGEMPVHVLVRPRGGDFVYTPEEVKCMEADITECRRRGVRGVVVGALTSDGGIDMEVCRRLVKAAEGMSVTFHRAFDMSVDPMRALEDVADLGCDRLLTSGRASSAEEGMELLCRLHEAARGRLMIMAGGGVSPKNAAMLMASGGIDELHASARVHMPSVMRFRNRDVAMGASGTDEYSRMVTDAGVVRDILAAMGV